MKRVFCSESLGDVHHLKNVLERHGIASVIRNEQLIGGLGDIPFLDCIPELWVLHDEQADQARAIVADQSQTVTGAPWRCTGCGEANEGQFALCWNCGAPAVQAD